MICKYCNTDIMDGASFCPVCGRTVETVVPEPVTPTTQGQISAAPILPEVLPAAPKKRSPLPVILGIALALCVVALVLGYLYFSNTVAQLERRLSDATDQIGRQKATITELEGAVAEKDNTIADLNKQVSSQKSTITRYERELPKAGYYDEIVTHFTGAYHSAVSNFFPSQSVFVLKKGDTRYFTLNANWPSGGTVSTDYSSTAAWVEFNSNNWRVYTGMTLHAVEPGICVIEFTNNRTSNTFEILVIVTD